MELLKKHKNIILISIFFGFLYSLISFVNHYYFRTYAMDLGAYTNALYDYRNFQWNDGSVFKNIGENLLANHFDLYLIFFAPLSFIFGTYTLLIVQIGAVVFGGLGVYALFISTKKDTAIVLFASVYFYLFFGVFAAISYDYHSNVVAAALIPWLFYLIARRRLLASSILFLIIIVSKENISLWLVFISIGLAIEYRKDAFLRNYLFFAAIFSALSFVLITSVIMPSISNNGSYPHFHYSYLGHNSFEAIQQLILHPFDAIKVLFTNHLHNSNGDFIKLELHILLIVSGLPLLIKKPQYILMLLPIYFQKLFHDNCSMWGVGGQYSIEYAPIMAIGIFMVISEFKKGKTIKLLSYTILFLTLASTIRLMDYTISYIDKSRIRFYQKAHYQRDYDVEVVHNQLSKIPKDAIVSAQSPFVPHLSLRDNVYQFPIIKDATYIVYSRKEGSYPLSKIKFDSLIMELEHSKNWKIVFDGSITILRSQP